MAYFHNLQGDPKYDQKLAHKRQVLAERGKRIFNPVLAKRNYDPEELKVQSQEKHVLKESERTRNAIFDQAAKQLDVVHNALKQHEQQLKRDLECEVIDYRRNHQRPEQSCVFDLNDPERLKKERPIGDRGNFSSFGPSSVVTFESDKLRTPDHIKDQILKQKEWLANQMHENRLKKNHEEYVKSIGDAEFLAQQRKRLEMDAAARELQKAISLANDFFNKALSRHQADYRLREKERDEMDRTTHIVNAMNSDLLNERSSHPRDHRGLTEEEQAEIYNAWRVQQQDRELERGKEHLEKVTWDNYFRAVQNEYLNKIEAVRKHKLEKRHMDDSINIALAKETVEKNDFIKHHTNNNPTDEYYEQFQRDPR